MPKIFLTLFSVFVLSTFSGQFVNNAHAQTISQDHYSITGAVKDTAQNAIPYATVFISAYAMPEKLFKAMACDNNGRFSQLLPKGKYIVKMISVGYKETKLTIELDSVNVDVGTIVLQENITQLAGITVRPLIESNAREIVYNITSDPDRAKSNMLDIFGKVPLLTVVDDRIVAGNDPANSVIVLRNGRQDALFSGGTSLNEVLRKLPALGFTNIKILLDKPEKYQEYDYVITVTPDKTQRLFGAVGESVASYRLDRNLNLQQKITASADKTRLASSIGYTWDKPLEKKVSSSTYSPDLSIENDEKTNAETNTYTGNIHISHDISEKQFIAGRFSAERADNNTLKSGTSEFRTGGLPAAIRNNKTYNDRINDVFEGYLSYHYDLKPNERIFSISYTFKALPSDNEQMQSIRDATGDLVGSTLKKTAEHQYSHYLSMDYLEKFSPRLSFTGRTSLLIENTDRATRKYNTAPGQESEEPGGYDYFERSVRRIDGRFTLSWLTSRKVNISAGVRPDYMLDSSGIKMISGTGAPSYYKERNWAFNSDLGVRIVLDRKKQAEKTGTAAPVAVPASPNILNISYLINQSRPSYSFLSSYVDDSNPDYLSTGNPRLKNETVHSISARFTNQLVSPTLSYSFSNDKITVYWYQNQDNKTVRSYINGGLYNNVTLGLNKTLWLSKDFSKMHLLTISIIGGHTREKIEGNNRERYSLSGLSMYQIRLFKEYSFSGNLFYNNFWDSGYSGMDIGKPFHLNLTLSRSFMFKNGMRLESMIRCDDVFGWNREIHSFVSTDSFSQEQYSINKKLPVSFTIRLNYGSFRVKPVKKAMSSGEIGGFASPEKEEE